MTQKPKTTKTQEKPQRKPRYGILGATGFLGQNMVRLLPKSVGGSRKLGIDARNKRQLINWIKTKRITHLINLAAECGGIGYNQTNPAKLWTSTTHITHTVLEVAVEAKLKKLTMIGTVCSYPELCPTPFEEDDLMVYGPPEKTNAAYGVAKLNGSYGCKAYRQEYGLNAIYLIPANMYGPQDHFNNTTSHVIPAIILKCIEGRINKEPSITLWGSGKATRDFLYVDDAAEAIILATNEYNSPEPLNIGTGEDISIRHLAELIKKLTGYKGRIKWDRSKPDGQLKRRLDISKITKILKFKPKISLEEGLERTIEYVGS